jgi:hypothetical protein
VPAKSVFGNEQQKTRRVPERHRGAESFCEEADSPQARAGVEPLKDRVYENRYGELCTDEQADANYRHYVQEDHYFPPAH